MSVIYTLIFQLLNPTSLGYSWQLLEFSNKFLWFGMVQEVSRKSGNLASLDMGL